MNWTKENIPDLNGKTIIVTGGNSGIGFEASLAFAQKGARVILTSRSAEKGEQSVEKIMEKVPGARLSYMILELTSLESIRKFASDFISANDRLDVLLNNAGIMMTPYSRTIDGFESQLGTNHLGHFALTGLLSGLLFNTPGSRIVNISSLAHKRGNMDFDNLLFENGKDYSPIRAYGRSKISNLFFTYELQRKIEKAGIQTLALAAHPGISDTNLGRHFENTLIYKAAKPFLGLILQSAEMGALPGIRASVDPQVKGGQYYGPGGRGERKGYPVPVKSNTLSHNETIARQLWEVSEKLTGVKFNI